MKDIQKKFTKELSDLLEKYSASFNYSDGTCFIMQKGAKLPIQSREKIGAKCIRYHLKKENILWN